jgi:hypothetical protein
VEAVKVVVICLHTGTCLLVGPVLRLSSNPMCDGEGVLRISYTAMGGRVVIWSQDLRRPANQSLLPSDSSLHGNLSAIHGPWRCICYLKSADVVQMLWRCSEQRKGTPHGKEQYVSGASMSSSNSQDTTHRIASHRNSTFTRLRRAPPPSSVVGCEKAQLSSEPITDELVRSLLLAARLVAADTSGCVALLGHSLSAASTPSQDNLL